MNNSKFTVVIPNFKRVTELVRALESVLNQELSEELLDSIIIVDDDSDNIDEIIAAVEKLNSAKIMMINNSFKSNAAVTRNQGLDGQKQNGSASLIPMIFFCQVN